MGEGLNASTRLPDLPPERTMIGSTFPPSRRRRWLLLFVLAVALPATPARGEDSLVGTGKKTLAQALAEAKAGTRIVLPAGTFSGPVALPEGVGLRGAAYDKTILEGGTHPVGLALKGRGSRVAELTVRTRGSSAVAAEDASDIEMRRVRVLGGALGFR